MEYYFINLSLGGLQPVKIFLLNLSQDSRNMGKKQNKTGGLRKQWTRIDSSELTNNLRVLNISIFNHSAMEDGGGGEGRGKRQPPKM